MVWEEMSCEEFQDGHGGHLGYLIRTILAILNLCVTVMLPIKFWLDGNIFHCIKVFLGYRNETILAIVNLYVALMPPLKFRLNLTYGFGGDIVRRILDIRTEQF